MAWKFYDDTGAAKVLESSGGGGDPTLGGDLTGTASTAQIASNVIVNADINASAAIALSKLATDPLARANHTGTQLAATISDFDTQVRTSRLDQMASPTASVAMGTQKLTGLAAGTTNGDSLRYEQVVGQYLLLSGGTLTGDVVSSTATTPPTQSSLVNQAYVDTVLTQAVEDLAEASHTHNVQDVGTGTRSKDTVLRGDNSWSRDAPFYIANMRQAGSDILAATCDPMGHNTTNAAVDGVLQITILPVHFAAVTTGAWMVLSASGVTLVADNNNKLALFTFDDTNLTCVAATANDSSMWTATQNTRVNVVWTSSYTLDPNLRYAIGRLYNVSSAGTAPSVRCAANLANSALSSIFYSGPRQSSTINRTNIAVADTIAWSGTTNSSVMTLMGLY